MIQSFVDKDTATLFYSERSRRFAVFARTALRKLIRRATTWKRYRAIWPVFMPFASMTSGVSCFDARKMAPSRENHGLPLANPP